MDYKEHASSNITYQIEERVKEAEELYDLVQKYRLFERIALELFTSIGIICVAANISIAFTIIKYTKFRQDKSNIIILNWTIVNSVFIISSAILVRITIDFTAFLSNDNIIYCVVKQMEFTFLQQSMLLMILLTIHWYLKLYHFNYFQKFNKHNIFFIISIYTYFCFCLGLHIEGCYNARQNYLTRHMRYIVFLSYIAYTLFMIAINIMHAIKKRKLVEYKHIKNVPVLISNAFFLSHLPIVTTELVFLWNLISDNFIFDYILVSSLLICVADSIYFIIILYIYGNDFNVYFKHHLKCRCYNYDNKLIQEPLLYDNELIEQPVLYDNEVIEQPVFYDNDAGEQPVLYDNGVTEQSVLYDNDVK